MTLLTIYPCNISANISIVNTHTTFLHGTESFLASTPILVFMWIIQTDIPPIEASVYKVNLCTGCQRKELLTLLECELFWSRRFLDFLALAPVNKQAMVLAGILDFN